MNETNDNRSDNRFKIIEKKYELENEQMITFLMIKFEGSFLLWIGESAASAQLADLSLAIGTNSTQILGRNAEELSPALASKLSIKYNKNRPVYVALNHPMAKSDNNFIVCLNQKIIEFLNENLN